MSAGFGDYGTADLARFRKFIERIARMNYDGEEREGDEPFVMENDDAVDTLNSLIMEARELTK